MVVSKNQFDLHGDIVWIKQDAWDFIATATIRDDYTEELKSVTWSKNGEYLYSQKLECYLHVYIMKKWYGDIEYEKMKNEGYVIDHMDNDGHNCRIDNLCFLTGDENKAKGMTVDKLSKSKTHIALSLYKDFSTGLIQMTIFFNFPAKAVISNLNDPVIIDLVHLLYDAEYEIVLNDARKILYDYRREFSFEPEKLSHADYQIEGSYGNLCSIDAYNRYIAGGHGYGIVFINKSGPLDNWTLDSKKQFFHVRGECPNSI